MSISFQEIRRRKAADRMEDFRRLEAGEVTAEQLQAENAAVPSGDWEFVTGSVERSAVAFRWMWKRKF